MLSPMNRRDALRTLGAGATVAATSGLSLASALPRRPGAKLRYAAVGCGGMGATDLRQIASHGDVEVVALCDVDTSKFGQAREHAPDAKTYQDFRVMLRELGGGIDAISVSTPDHMHAPIAIAAMAMGIHVYCQKPLTRTVEEARAMATLAKSSGVVTQMGIQNHSNENYDAALALFKADLIGKIHEVHVWTDRPAGWWAQGVERTEGSEPTPETLDWDLWLGTAPERPYRSGYHPFQWRGREDFGTGAQGDMACHLMDPALWFLGLMKPLTLRSDGPAPNGESFPLWSRIHYTFPGNDLTTRGPVQLTWHDGGKKPSVDLLESLGTDRDSIPANACLFVGTKGALIANPYGRPVLLTADKFKDVEIPAGVKKNHWHQWVDACMGRGKTTAPFAYSAHLSEVALLGNVALRFPHETLTFDGGNMRFPGRPEADAFLRSAPREGWEFLSGK